MACPACATREEAEWEARVGDIFLEFNSELDREVGGRVGDVFLEGNFAAPWAFEQQDLEIIGTDDRTKVTDTRQAPFRYICNLEFTVPGRGRVPGCTGTLIGPRTVLTAGHCIDTVQAAQVRVIPGRNRSLEPLPATQATRLILAPGFAEVSPTDIGIVQLADPIGSQVGFWTPETHRNPGDSVGTSISRSGNLPLPDGKIKVNLSGYPGDKPDDAALKCRDPNAAKQRCFISNASSGRSSLCGTEQWKAYDLEVERRGGLLHYLDDTCPGHSGSPVWVRRHPSMGGRVMVAVHIAADDGVGVVANRGVLITGRIGDFIRAHCFSPAGTIPPGRPTVRSGSRGIPVEELQYRLNIFLHATPAVGQPLLKADGIFGPKTLAAARAFQRAMSLTVDGIVGPQTWRRLQLPF